MSQQTGSASAWRNASLLIGAVTLLVASAHASPPFGSVSLTLSATNGSGAGTTNLFSASTTDGYHHLRAMSRMSSVAQGLRMYANEHGHFPDRLSRLFQEGYVASPCDFHNPGDSDPAPLSIDNDVPDAPNSARVSYEYLVANQPEDIPVSTIMLIDRHASNNAGQGRVCVRASSAVEFLEDPAPYFANLFSRFGNCLQGSIRRGAANSVAYPAFISNGTWAQGYLAPHRAELQLSGSVTQSYLNIFNQEGFGNDNYVTLTSTSIFWDDVLRVEGSGPSPAIATLYCQYDFALSLPPGDEADSASMQFFGAWAPFNSSQTTTGTFYTLTMNGLLGAVVGTTKGTFGNELSYRVVAPGQPDYVSGSTTIAIRGVMQCELPLVAGQEGSLFMQGLIVSRRRVTPQSTLGRPMNAHAIFETATRRNPDQVRVFVTPGYSCNFTSADPDLFITTRRGDPDMDGVIWFPDFDGFAAAYSDSRGTPAYVEPEFSELANFDFDADGDVDCADFDAFAAAWTSAWPVPDFAPCHVRRVPLSVEVAGHGNVTREPASDLVPVGTVVRLTAAPDIGSRFESWTGDIAESSSVVEFVVSEATSVLAIFDTICPAPFQSAGATQLPDQQPHGGVIVVPLNSLNGPTAAAESFTPNADLSIDGIRWWGIYWDVLGRETTPDDRFSVGIFHDQGGFPGEPIAIFPPGSISIERRRTGTRVGMQQSFVSSYPELRFDARFPAPIDLSAGETYWLELSASPQPLNNAQRLFGWETSGTGDGAALRDRGTPGYQPTDIQQHDLAMSLLALPLGGCRCVGDASGDGTVDLVDLALLLSNFGNETGSTVAQGDMDADGDVDLVDLATLLSRFGLDCE